MRYFVIRGFGKKKDSSGRIIDFDRVDQELIAPALAQCGLVGGTTGQVVEAGSIHEDMFRLILQADLVICDITVHNANVFYELGVRHALRKKHTVLIKGSPGADTTPFDIGGDRYTSYPLDSPRDGLGALVTAVQASIAGHRAADSPIFLMLPRLPEADVSSVALIPLDFVEEVKQAEARADRGWLRLLAEDVRGEQFQWEGLKTIGRAQWTLKDYAGAITTWEAVRTGSPQDLDANLALANLFERQYKASEDPTLLELSNQAILRVLDREVLSPADRSEALALQGRNMKTLWRLAFRNLDTPEQRREKALDAKAKLSYEAYRDAFKTDLNNFFPGLAAYQMGRILQALAQSPRFQNLFTSDRQRAAKRYLEDLERDLAALAHVVQASIERSLTTAKGDNLVWAQISAADLLFLSEAEDTLQSDPSIAVDAYRNALPGRGFFWDAARGQLDLFQQLGIRATAANAVITVCDGALTTKTHGKLHLVVFSGHTIDRADAPKPRFPATAEAAARETIEKALLRLKREDERMVVLASAAPGADILALEACGSVGIETWLCLPMERNVVADEVFSRYEDGWRNRFFALVDAQAADRTFILHRAASLPRWLSMRQMSVWSRGNRWMLRLAESWGADRITLLAFWDRNEQDTSTDGTAEMVRMARKAGAFVEIIDLPRTA